MHRRRLVAAALVAALGVSGTACSSSDGRALPRPDAAMTTTTPSTPVIQTSDPDAGIFRLQSSTFLDTDVLPERLTCRDAGGGTSPALSWTGTPGDAVALAVVARDTTAGGLVHWLITGIDPAVQGFAEGGLPESAIEGPNGGGGLGWLAPCPDAGDSPHTYEFALLALPALVVVPDGATAEQEASLLEAAAGERAVITGIVQATAP